MIAYSDATEQLPPDWDSDGDEGDGAVDERSDAGAGDDGASSAIRTDAAQRADLEREILAIRADAAPVIAYRPLAFLRGFLSQSLENDRTEAAWIVQNAARRADDAALAAGLDTVRFDESSAADLDGPSAEHRAARDRFLASRRDQWDPEHDRHQPTPAGMTPREALAARNRRGGR